MNICEYGCNKIGKYRIGKKKTKREKSKKTCIKRYGVESQNQSKMVKENKRLSMIKKYSVENPFQIPIKRYGPSGSYSYKRKEYIFPSGR